MKKKLRKITISTFLLICVAIFSTHSANADDSMASTNASSSASTSIVKYDLEYPGLLPDSPFYKLKVFRDKMSEALISDPKKKIDFYLLQTDKGILASAMLVDKGEID